MILPQGKKRKPAKGENLFSQYWGGKEEEGEIRVCAIRGKEN